jgi:hypothetical protein
MALAALTEIALNPRRATAFSAEEGAKFCDVYEDQHFLMHIFQLGDQVYRYDQPRLQHQPIPFRSAVPLSNVPGRPNMLTSYAPDDWMRGEPLDFRTLGNGTKVVIGGGHVFRELGELRKHLAEHAVDRDAFGPNDLSRQALAYLGGDNMRIPDEVRAQVDGTALHQISAAPATRAERRLELLS